MLPSSTSEPLMAKDITYKVKVENKTRRFKVHIPKGYKSERKLPMVIVLHGAVSNSFNIGLASGMSQKADQFFAVYPIGSGLIGGAFRTWNACGPKGPVKWNKSDDVEFLKLTIDKMKSIYPIDERRVYLAGMSNGGMMAYRFAAELPEYVSAVGVVEAVMFSGRIECNKPVSVVAFHSEKDFVLPINGGRGQWLTYRFDCPAVQDSLDYWIKRNGCKTNPTISKQNGLTQYTYDSGRGNSSVVLYKTEDGGHSWPGGFRIRPFYNPSRKINATDEMLKFFFSHPKPANSMTKPLEKNIGCMRR